MMITGVDPVAVFPFHTDVGGACVVPLQHGAFRAFDTWNDRDNMSVDDSEGLTCVVSVMRWTEGTKFSINSEIDFELLSFDC